MPGCIYARIGAFRIMVLLLGVANDISLGFNILLRKALFCGKGEFVHAGKGYSLNNK